MPRADDSTLLEPYVAIQKILIVDDSPTERLYLTDILVKNGFTVCTAVNGDEAIERIRAERPQLILMDVVMPGTNGFQVTRAISRDPELAALPIIICSSKDQETDRIWGMRQGAKEYLVKPVDPARLLAAIAALAVPGDAADRVKA
jgi:twitching motility two-component system response regulator PilH